MKLKKLLEGYAWERKSDGSLPTLSDAIQSHSKSLSEVASVKIGADTFTVTAANNGVNVRGGAINNNYNIKVDAFIDIPVEIKDVSMIGSNVKIKAAAMGMEKEGMLDIKQIAQIIDQIEAGKKEFRIPGEENTFIFNQV
jgi:3-deoxy-D-arabino-heptulosonate 7-phosphate (DAHP) synthase